MSDERIEAIHQRNTILHTHQLHPDALVMALTQARNDIDELLDHITVLEAELAAERDDRPPPVIHAPEKTLSVAVTLERVGCGKPSGVIRDHDDDRIAALEAVAEAAETVRRNADELDTTWLQFRHESDAQDWNALLDALAALEPGETDMKGERNE